MKAIIIQDTDAANLLDLLKLEQFNEPQMWSNSATWHSLPPLTRQQMIGDMHQKFHYIVTRWLQEQGASCVR